MRYIVSFYVGLFLLACNTDHDALPLGNGITLKMAVEGGEVFEDNIYSLNIYAFRKSRGGEYVYYRTLATLGKGEIDALEDGADNKLFTTRLSWGNYKLFFVANASENYKGELQPYVTKPSDVFLTMPEGGVDSVYFLGNTLLKVTDETIHPIPIELKRAVSRLGVVLYGVPESIDSIRFDLHNIATMIAIDGSVFPENTTLSGSYVMDNNDVYRKDTMNYSFLTFPTAVGKSDLSLTFVGKSGEEKSEVISSVVLMPDQYAVVKGDIDDHMGAFLSFHVTIHYFILDNSKDFFLPDFTLTPSK